MLVGLTMNVVLGQVHAPHAMVARVACLVCGVFLNGVATGAYIGAGLGPGPRDGLMTGPRRAATRSVSSVPVSR